MNVSFRPAAHVRGSVTVPGDKSISHRAAIFGAIAHGATHITNFLRASDTKATLECLQKLGADIQDDGATITVNGKGFAGLITPEEPLYCGNSGTTMRLLMGVLAGTGLPVVMEGDESLSRRPMDRMKVPLEQMGANIQGSGERSTPPVSVHGGNLKGISYNMPMASAQVKTGILLAGLQAEGTTTVIEPAAARDHTERMLHGFGVDVITAGDRVSVQGGARLEATDVQVPGDISSAAFFLVAAALRPGWEVTVRDVGTNPTRTGVVDVLRAMGVSVELQNERVSGGEPLADIVVRGGELKATEIGGALIPRLIDELPVLALLASQAEGTTVIRDAAEMRVKESDRIAVIAAELRKLGAQIEEQPDGMIITGPTKLVGTTVTSPRGDHRIAMSLAVASLIAEGETHLQNADAISSSFPNFLELLDQVRTEAA